MTQKIKLNKSLHKGRRTRRKSENTFCGDTRSLLQRQNEHKLIRSHKHKILLQHLSESSHKMSKLQSWIWIGRFSTYKPTQSLQGILEKAWWRGDRSIHVKIHTTYNCAPAGIRISHIRPEPISWECSSYADMSPPFVARTVMSAMFSSMPSGWPTSTRGIWNTRTWLNTAIHFLHISVSLG